MNRPDWFFNHPSVLSIDQKPRSSLGNQIGRELRDALPSELLLAQVDLFLLTLQPVVNSTVHFRLQLRHDYLFNRVGHVRCDAQSSLSDQGPSFVEQGSNVCPLRHRPERPNHEVNNRRLTAWWPRMGHSTKDFRVPRNGHRIWHTVSPAVNDQTWVHKCVTSGAAPIGLKLLERNRKATLRGSCEQCSQKILSKSSRIFRSLWSGNTPYHKRNEQRRCNHNLFVGMHVRSPEWSHRYGLTRPQLSVNIQDFLPDISQYLNCLFASLAWVQVFRNLRQPPEMLMACLDRSK